MADASNQLGVVSPLGRRGVVGDGDGGWRTWDGTGRRCCLHGRLFPLRLRIRPGSLISSPSLPRRIERASAAPRNVVHSTIDAVNAVVTLTTTSLTTRRAQPNSEPRLSPSVAVARLKRRPSPTSKRSPFVRLLLLNPDDRDATYDPDTLRPCARLRD